jgi:hypothetical protein
MERNAFDSRPPGASPAPGTNCVTARTWREFARHEDAGYELADNTNLGLSGWLIKKRGFIDFLERAQPSKASHVHGLPMNRSLWKILPIDLGPQVSNEEIQVAAEAMKEGKSWLDLYPDTRIESRSGTMLHLEAGHCSTATVRFGSA